MKIKRRKISLLVALIGVLALREFAIYSDSEPGTEDSEYQEAFNEDYRIYSLNIPMDLEFCGEPVPVYDLDIRERLDRELLVNTYWQSNSMLYIKRSKKWFPIIEPILAENGIPNDFKYLALIESGLTNVVSPAGATGYWQIMKKTGIQYGLEITNEVDERYHVKKATQAACDYLKEAYAENGSWTLTAASYNMGISGVNRQLKRQKADSYYDLLLNNETSRYVFRILAAKEILSNPSKYGFRYREKDLYPAPEVKQIVLDTSVSNLAQYALDLGTTYKVLKIFNPWLRKDHLTNTSGKTYTIELPVNGYFNHDGSRELNPALFDSLEALLDSTATDSSETDIKPEEFNSSNVEGIESEE